MKNLASKSASIGLAMMLVTGGAAVAVTDNTEHAMACTISVAKPNTNNNGYMGRAGCSSAVFSEGKVMQDVFGPDTQVGIRTFNAGMGWVNGTCGWGEGKYYSDFKSGSSGTKKQSTRVTRC